MIWQNEHLETHLIANLPLSIVSNVSTVSSFIHRFKGFARGFVMKARLIAVLTLAMFVMSISMASAQFGRRGMAGGLQLLRIPEVQKELSMTDAQIGKLDAKQQEVGQAMQEARQGVNFQQMSAEERQQLMTKMQDIQTKAVADVLDAKQMKRFHQLELQQAGPMALTRKDVATDLKLTDDQKEKIGKIQTQVNEDSRAAMQGLDPRNMSEDDRTKLMAKNQEIQKAAGDKLTALLTDDQKKQWKDMQGEPFKFPAFTPPRRGA